MEAENQQLETELGSGNLDYVKLQEKSVRYVVIGKLIEEKTNKWLELAEME